MLSLSTQWHLRLCLVGQGEGCRGWVCQLSQTRSCSISLGRAFSPLVGTNTITKADRSVWHWMYGRDPDLFSPCSNWKDPGSRALEEAGKCESRPFSDTQISLQRVCFSPGFYRRKLNYHAAQINSISGLQCNCVLLMFDGNHCANGTGNHLIIPN